ncbi:DNA-binding winged helix-turn-helix (wHTH) protein [Evansella vedderi]|uniref:DNA-binding winged helix-turn-helix (WHTH) protein n=1 Tax=Evansella vedderi TaxID=38282 RepID=A0ABT9ZZ38_9BACI|nr:hypothetical protein [Evansella vedderi]MDQ0255370.1 DNA-binding winged helix-turn-helix (wHTH) protein [Evansella vedderi]
MQKIKLTPVQLQQKIIHLQSEIGKYKKQINDYQENYHYSLLEELREENKALVDKNELLETSYKEIYEKNQQLEQEINEIKTNLSKKEEQNQKLLEELKEVQERFNKVEKKEHSPFINQETSKEILKSTDETEWFTRNLQNQVKVNKNRKNK